ncbi:nitrate- and nitrite sensing domain-containing protein [Streptomyces sp. WAC06614]|uniref:nitrate- and nitrite sensing domain-containing protein n=1 Tax=Streptomyces sp. WAC06614 TaxID=2487416 RepID=UPI000F7B15FD|nr:nitrate- and nitrite sensing domain-containing protein [Streptomyces sp. WAC06614]RSS74025.1 HAMP domain-containing protein [Streptomyces sp. WAC06614]
MQKKRSRKNGTAHAEGRTVRVRRRLVVGVAVAGLAVLGAGAPAVVSASADLNDTQALVGLAEQTRLTVTLGHLLADERDAVTEFAAKGRPAAGKAAVQERTARADRQLAEVLPEADEELAQALGRIPAVRDEAVNGKGTALAAHQAYSAVIADLLAPGARLAERTPPRADAALATNRPLIPLGLAVEQASATRGLLLASLAVQPAGSAAADELSGAAQRSRVREQGALDDFNRAARPDVRQTLAATVTGPEVKAADEQLKRLTERPVLTAADRARTDAPALATALTARIDRMRSVESALATQRSEALAALRDADVSRLELLTAFLGVLFLLAVGVSTAVARSLTRPLSVLRRGAARLATAEGSVEPVKFTGRNDEFADVVRSMNAMREQTVALHTKIAGMDADRRRLIGRNEALSSGRTALEAELAELRTGLEEHRRILSTTSVSLSLRTLGLVERQLAVIEELESREQDPDRLATLFRLDHLATVMRRHNENLLVLAGQEHGPGHAHPVPLVDVLRAAVSEIERYERVDLRALPAHPQVAGHAADDLSHVLAELLENATTFSPPDAKVKVSGRILDNGDAVLSVLDEGIGITEDRLAALNVRLASPDAYDAEPESEHGLGLGLYVAGRLAARHGVTAELRAGRHAGTEAVVVIPATLLPVTPALSPIHTLADTGVPALHLPGAVAEANEHTLPPRIRPYPTATAADQLPDLETPEATTAPEPGPEHTLEIRLPADPEAEAESEPEAEPAAALEPEAEPAAGPETVPADAPEPRTEPEPTAGPEPEPELTAEPEADAVPAALPEADAVPAGTDEPAVRSLAEGLVEGAGEPVDGPLPAAEQIFTAAAPAAAPAPARPSAGGPAAADADSHAQARDEAEGWVPRQGSHPEESDEAVTATGLPKRTPRVVAAGRAPAARPEPRKKVDAEELRRRLGGFYQGALDGRRVVEAELAADRGHNEPGDTAQEART